MSIPDEGFNTIDAWHARLRESAETCARRFISVRDSLPADIRKALFAVELSDAEIRDSFEYARANYARPLSGVPYFLKDNFDVRGLPTFAGSSFLGKVRGIPTVPCRLYETLHSLGAVFAGKTQMTEFAADLSGENSISGNCPNPLDPSRLSGGSSSGSAAAVGAGLVPMAFGTDTAGSVRVPAAFCGVFGLRIQPGPLSREGVFPWAPSFDAAGWFTGSAADMATLCTELGYGSPRSKEPPKPVLWCGELFESPDAELNESYSYLAQCLGAVSDPEACELLRPHISNAVRAFDVLRDAESYEKQKALLASFANSYSPKLRARLEAAGRRTPKEIEQAKREAADLAAALHEVFSDYDVLAWPITPSVAPKMDHYTPGLRQALLSMNVPVSLARLPALALPAITGSGLSGGIQCVFPSEVRMDVPNLLRNAGYFEQT